MHVSAVVLAAIAAVAPVSGEVFVKLPGGTFKADAAHWGGWIADVEKPQSSGFSGRGVDIARVDGETVSPPPRGSVTLKLAQPWPKCAVGDRFNGAYLTIGATHKYQLGEGIIVGCSPGNVTINYSNLAPRN